MNTPENHQQDGVFGPGTPSQLDQVARVTKVPVEALNLAALKKQLAFGKWRQAHVYAVTDVTNNLTEVRRMNGERFKVRGKRPVEGLVTHEICVDWPIGITEAHGFPSIALVEGSLDFLSAHQICLAEGLADRVAPVAMLRLKPIFSKALPLFTGKRVCIFAHADQLGAKAARTWSEQLTPYASSVQVVDFADFLLPKCHCLHDIMGAHTANFPKNPEEWRLLPTGTSLVAGDEWKEAA